MLLKKKSDNNDGIGNFIQQTSSNVSYNKLKKGKKSKHPKFNIDMEEYLKQDYDDMDFEDALKYDNQCQLKFFFYY